VNTSSSADSARKLLAAEAQNKASDAGWDQAAQTYLGLVALNQACSRLENRPLNPQVTAEFKQMLGSLTFPANYDSPRQFGPEKFEARLAELRKLLRE
jgi:hypothetical protein